ncbi:basic proline-rich protein-like [Camelus ferus]|uniref:Basic proline-rich protein-like n=1 Tax=Camelus ferus TaxID=419612 RepID=A0A8B8TPY2_CAMFR|nr:basic proline-rich protein-like [Camelus ferus]
MALRGAVKSTRTSHTGNPPRQPGKNWRGEETPGGPLSSKDNNTPRKEPGAAGSRVGAAEGGAPRRPGDPESPQPAQPLLGESMRGRSPPRPLPARPPQLTAGVSGSQPRAGAAVRRRRRRRDPGPRRRVIIPPARAGPGPGPCPPEPSPRPSRGGSPLSLPPAPPPGPSPPPPPPPQPRALPPRPPAAVRGHHPAPCSAAAVVARPDELSAEQPPLSGRPRLAGTSPPPRAMTPTEAEVPESRNLENIKSYTGLTWETSQHGEQVSMRACGAREKPELVLWGGTYPAGKAGFKDANCLPYLGSTQLL